MIKINHRKHKRRFARLCGAALISILTVATLPGTVLSQEAGVSASVPVVEEGEISPDGDLSEWADLPLTVTVDGPEPSDDPGTRGRLRWQVASDSTTVYLAATVTDDAISVGDNPDRYWNDDSIEFYLNVSGDLTATEYGPGISQMRITPVELGDDAPVTATVNGTNFDQFPVTGVVFTTEDGWGTEVAVDISEFASPMVGDRVGIQIHLNGSSGSDRDIKLIWSARDVEDTSFEDPSVFGQGVFVSDVGSSPGAATGDEDGVVEPLSPEISELESTGPEVITGSEQQRSLLIAAVVSSIAVLFGGLWFERKRKKDEARHREASRADVERELPEDLGSQLWESQE